MIFRAFVTASRTYRRHFPVRCLRHPDNGVSSSRTTAHSQNFSSTARMGRGRRPATFEIWVNQRLAAAQADVDKLVAVSGPRTIANTLRPYDDAVSELAIAGYESYFMFAVGDEAPLRDKAQAMSSKSPPPTPT